MIRPLRRRHRLTWTVLALLLPLGLLSALAARQPPPVNGEPPVAWSAEGPAQRLELAGGVGIELSAAPGDSARLALRLSSPLERPGVLVYWSPVAASEGALPDQARLLGSLSAEHVRIVPRPPSDGFLLLYSLLDGVVLGDAELRTAGG